tara:strand:- start:122 stop:883 length:762 start_codon:yes stop_codon:yes gene_type:complete
MTNALVKIENNSNPESSYSYRIASKFAGFEILEDNFGKVRTVAQVTPPKHLTTAKDNAAFIKSSAVIRFIETYVDTLNETDESGLNARIQYMNHEPEVAQALIQNGVDRQADYEYDVANLDEPNFPEENQQAYKDLFNQVQEMWGYSTAEYSTTAGSRIRLIVQKKASDTIENPLVDFYFLTDNKPKPSRPYDLSLSKAIHCMGHSLKRYCAQETYLLADTLSKLPFTAFSKATPDVKTAPRSASKKQRKGPQ